MSIRKNAAVAAVVVGGFVSIVSKMPFTKPIEVVDYSQYDKDSHTEEFYQDIKDSGSTHQKELSKDQKFLEREIEIYEFLDGKGLHYLEGELNQYSYDYEKELNKTKISKIKEMYYKFEETSDKKLERILSYYLNSSKKYIDLKGIEVANNILERDIEFKVSTAINEGYRREGEETIIDIQNIDDLVSIETSEESLGEKVISVKDPETDVAYPYTAGNNHNIVYDSVELYEETNENLEDDERMRVRKKIAEIRKILNQAITLRGSKVETGPGNQIVTEKPKTVKKKVLKLYK